MDKSDHRQSRQLISQLRQLADSQNFFLDAKKKSALKHRLLSITSENLHPLNLSLISQLQRDIQQIKPPIGLKSRILNKITTDDFLVVLMNLLGSIRRPLMGGATLAVFIFFSLAFNPTPLYATPKIILEITAGSAKITRKGAPLTTGQRAILEAGDIITTAPDSQATIYFPNQAVSRLSPDSEIEIKSVVINPQKPTDNNIRIAIKQGRVWSNVARSQQEQGVFHVSTPFAEAKATQKTTFDINVNSENSVQISTIENSLHVSLNNQESIRMAQGEKAEIKTEGTTIASLDSTIATKSDLWIADNMIADKKLKTEKIAVTNSNYPTDSAAKTEEKTAKSAATENTSTTTIDEAITTTENKIENTALLIDPALLNIVTNAQLFLKLETAPLQQNSATPDATLKRSHQAILDLYFEQRQK